MMWVFLWDPVFVSLPQHLVPLLVYDCNVPDKSQFFLMALSKPAVSLTVEIYSMHGAFCIKLKCGDMHMYFLLITSQRTKKCNCNCNLRTIISI